MTKDNPRNVQGPRKQKGRAGGKARRRAPKGLAMRKLADDFEVGRSAKIGRHRVD